MVYNNIIIIKMSIIVHSKDGCKYCELTKEFLTAKNIPYQVIHYDPLLTNYDKMKTKLINQTNHLSFPQLFVGDAFIGGYTELLRSYETCKLHELCQEIGIIIAYDF